MNYTQQRLANEQSKFNQSVNVEIMLLRSEYNKASHSRKIEIIRQLRELGALTW